MGVSRIKKIGGVGESGPAAAGDTLMLNKFLPEHVQDPRTFTKQLNTQLEAIKKIVDDHATSPLLGGNVLHDVVFTAAQTQSLKHGLGKPWSGYVVIRAQTAGALIFDVANPTGASSKDIITLKSTNAGIYDIWVF